MTPEPWEAIILALAVYRACRIIGWDDITRRFRHRITHTSEVAGQDYIGPGADNPRHELMKFLHCPFCVGFWLSIGAYVAWRLEPGATLSVASVLALSAAAGLIAKQLDP